ncbi:ParB N-terminal domain-containing protein (plasmid) [Pseudomonas corrugata]|uniref:ParB/RepB/Spo0J family partition protein n=1 Tax=Pseudomonas corrugata TaxID=47879 RepID=UPI003D813D28
MAQITDMPLPQLRYFRAGDLAHPKYTNDHIEALAADILANGINKPLIVRPVGDMYEVVCGLKRWKAALVAGLQSVPVEVRTLSDAEAASLAAQDNFI